MIKLKLFQAMAARDVKKQKDLATLTGLTPQSVSKLFRAETDSIHFKTLDRLCKALDCDIGDLLEFVPDGE